VKNALDAVRMSAPVCAGAGPKPAPAFCATGSLPVSLAGASNPTLRFVHDFFTEGGYDGGTIEINLNGAWTKLESADFTLNPYNGSMSLDSTAPNWTPTSRGVFTGYRTPGSFPNLAYAESRVALGSYLARDTDKVVQLRFRVRHGLLQRHRHRVVPGRHGGLRVPLTDWPV